MNDYLPKKSLASWIYKNPDSGSPEIKDSVLDYLSGVAEKVLDDLELDLDIVDIIIVGSALSYNYTKESDVDLHFVVDFEAEYDELTKDQLKELLGYFTKYWNGRDLFYIGGHKVEVYFNDIHDTMITPAAYSLTKNTFLKKPRELPFDEKSIDEGKSLAKELSLSLEIILESEDIEGAVEWKTEVKDSRKEGLIRDGVFSPENIAFKYLRSWGDIQKVSDFIDSYV